MAILTNQKRVDALIQSFWKNGYLTLSRKYGTYLPDPKPIGNYSVDAIGKQRKKYVIGLTITDRELEDPKIKQKIEFLATRHSKYSHKKVSLFIGVNKENSKKLRKIISELNDDLKKNIKIVQIEQYSIN